VIGFILIFALWTIYFLHHAERGAAALARSGTAAVQRAGSVFTYAHAVMVGAVIAVAVAVHMAVQGPKEAVSAGVPFICPGAPALFVVGIAWSTRCLGPAGGCPRGIAGVALLVLGIPATFGNRLSELVAAAVVASVMSLLSVRDYGLEPAV